MSTDGWYPYPNFFPSSVATAGTIEAVSGNSDTAPVTHLAVQPGFGFAEVTATPMRTSAFFILPVAIFSWSLNLVCGEHQEGSMSGRLGGPLSEVRRRVGCERRSTAAAQRSPA